MLKKFTALLEEYFKGDIDIVQAIDTYKEHKVPDKFCKDVVVNAIKTTLDKSGNKTFNKKKKNWTNNFYIFFKDQEREKTIKFLTYMRKENLVNANAIQESFKLLCNSLEERENELTKVTSAAASLLSLAVAEHLILLADVAVLTDNGTYYPLFLLVLQQLQKTQGKSELTELFNTSKVNLLSQLPESDKTKMRLAEILEERDLTFLYPPLRIQAELSKQLQADPNPQQFYKWIRENLDAANYIDSGFINALMTVLLKYITQV